MNYAVKEIFYTLQGEGAQAGGLRFLPVCGCNLWSGREADRATAVCRFCDTEFVGVDGAGGGKLIPRRHWLPLLRRSGWKRGQGRRFVVCTGGEPLLQMDSMLIEALHARGFEIAVETNGTVAAPAGLDWICVSPKAGAGLVQLSGDELKLVYPQIPFDPGEFLSLSFKHFFLQPMDGPAAPRIPNWRSRIAWIIRVEIEPADA